MYVVSFSGFKLTEFTDPKLFQHQVGKWMEIREAENSYLLGRLPAVVAQAQQSGRMPERLFALMEGDQILAAGMFFPEGCFCHTWASPAMLDSLADGLVRANCRITSTLGPAHVSWQLAEKLAERTRQSYELGRAERVYQLTRVGYATPTSGRLEMAVESDRAQLLPWMQGFVIDTDFETGAMKAEHYLDGLIRERALYLWKEPQAVSMAACAAPTAHGASINFVYTPPEYRGRGYAKAVVAGLASRMLASGLSYCFILTDTDDERTNKLYQSVGAHTLCELLRCTIRPPVAATLMGHSNFSGAAQSNGVSHANERAMAR